MHICTNMLTYICICDSLIIDKFGSSLYFFVNEKIGFTQPYRSNCQYF
jgi:hypothetical protein